jgi:hypothetical protein
MGNPAFGPGYGAWANITTGGEAMAKGLAGLEQGEGGERLFRAGGPADPGEPAGAEDAGSIRELPVRVDFVKLTGEGRLQIALIGEAVRGEDLAKVRDLLAVMQGRVFVDFTPEQGARAP